MVPLELDPWYPAKQLINTSRNSSNESVTGSIEAEGTTVTSWNIEDLKDDFFTDQWEDISDDVDNWKEPVPTADPISALSESLYPPDNSITDISRELKIGELLTLVVPCTLEQQARCHELLSDCGVGRLRRLIPWLHKRTWCGEKLQLFLEFRNHWESTSNVRWWEIFYWSEFDQAWIPQYLNSTLTLEYTREIVENRVGLVVSEVIGQDWYDDWEDSVAWEHGIRSFANFAVFRSGIPDGIYWREYLVRQDRRTALEIAQCTDPGFAPFMLPSIMRQYSCPWVVDASTDPWPDVTDMVHRRAAALGGNLAQAWEEIIDGITGY